MARSSLVRTMSGAALSGILLVSTVAFAGQGRGPKSPEEHEARVEAGVREKLAPKLGLDERTTDKLVELLRAQGEKRHAARANVQKERGALKDLVEKKAPDAALETQLRRLDDAQAAMPRPGALLSETRSILTVRQQAELTLLLPTLARQGRGDGPGRHHGPRGQGGRNAQPAPNSK